MPAIDPNSIIAANPVYHAMNDREYTGTSGDYLNVGHSAALALKAATISMSFSLDRLVGDRRRTRRDHPVPHSRALAPVSAAQVKRGICPL